MSFEEIIGPYDENTASSEAEQISRIRERLCDRRVDRTLDEIWKGKQKNNYSLLIFDSIKDGERVTLAFVISILDLIARKDEEQDGHVEIRVHHFKSGTSTQLADVDVFSSPFQKGKYTDMKERELTLLSSGTETDDIQRVSIVFGNRYALSDYREIYEAKLLDGVSPDKMFDEFTFQG